MSRLEITVVQERLMHYDIVSISDLFYILVGPLLELAETRYKGLQSWIIRCGGTNKSKDGK